VHGTRHTHSRRTEANKQKSRLQRVNCALSYSQEDLLETRWAQHLTVSASH